MGKATLICLAVVKIIVSNLKHTLSCNGSSWDQVWHGFRPFSVCGSVQTGTSFPHTPPLSFLPPRFHAFHPLYFLDRLTSPFFIFFLLFALLSLFFFFLQLEAGMQSLSSEYDSKYHNFDASTYGHSGTRLTIQSKPAAPLPPVVLSYESTYDTMTAQTKSSSRKVNVVAQHAAHSAAVRTNKRRMSIAVAEAAGVARDNAQEKEYQGPATEMHPELQRRFSLIAVEAAEKSAETVSTTAAPAKKNGETLVFGDDAQYSSSAWSTTYANGYRAPDYLKKMARAAEAAAVAAIQFKRETGLCSEYLASFEEFGSADMAHPCNVPTDMNMVGECLDFTQADATNQQPSTHTFIPRRVAWSSEYAGAFSEDEIDETQGTTTTERATAPANSDGNQVMQCMDWVGSTPSPAPVADVESQPTTGRSMYSKDFHPHKYTPQQAYLPSAVTEISSCMDWEAAVASSTAATKTAGETAGATKADDWVMVERPAVLANRAVIPGWGSVKSSEQMITTYDWDFDGAWKSFRPKAKKKISKSTSKGTVAAKEGLRVAAEKAAARASRVRQNTIHALATQKGVGKQSANELYVAEKMLPFFATGSEYQKKFSVPAAVRSAAVSKVVEQQKVIASKIKKINRPNTENNPILRGKRLGLLSMKNETSYQSSYGGNRQSSIKARVRALAAAEKQA